MSEYSELIKDFSKIRDYMRDFYVYGFKSREDFDRKSLRSYDTIRRRIESYMGDYVAFRRDETGKAVYLEVDSSKIDANPLYRVFKTKSFTKNDIMLHFTILDLLSRFEILSVEEISNYMVSDYVSLFKTPMNIDTATIRNKLNEYVKLEILSKKVNGKTHVYMLFDTFEKNQTFDLAKNKDAIDFYSETSPLGVVGSYIRDRISGGSFICFKHHYMSHVLDSEIVFQLLEAIHGKYIVEIINHSKKQEQEVLIKAVPLRILISVQTGRSYVSAYSLPAKAIINFRLDYIKAVKVLEFSDLFDDQRERLNCILKNTWGTSFGKGDKLEHLTMVVLIKPYEHFVIYRLEQEGRHGVITQLSEFEYQYDIDVYDAMEMLPWIRTFTGKIKFLSCDNKAIVNTFYQDIDLVYNYYFER